MTRETALDVLGGIYVVNDKVARGIITEIYDDIDASMCKNCTWKDACLILDSVTKNTKNIEYDYVEEHMLNSFWCSNFSDKNIY